MPSTTTREGAGLGDGVRVGDDAGGLGVIAALGAEAAERVDRLRLQPDMAKHGDAALDQEADGFGHGLAALELDAGAAGFSHDSGGIAEGLGGLLLVAAERHVDDDAGPLRAPNHRGAMRDHHLERHRQGAVEAIDDHAQGIARQQQIGDGIEQPRHRRAVGGQANDRHAALARMQRGRGVLLLGYGDAHGPPPTGFMGIGACRAAASGSSRPG